MVNLIAGLIGVSMVVVFLGTYAIKLKAIPLWIIIGAILAMVIFDFVQSTRAGKGRTQADDGGTEE